MALLKKNRRFKIKKRIRKIVFGTSECPRLTVFRSNKEIYTSLVDDVMGTIVCSTSSLSKDFNSTGTKVEKSKEVGKKIGLSKNYKVIEIGSNDGFLTKQFKNMGCDVVGIDPSQYMAQLAMDRGIKTYTTLFNFEAPYRVELIVADRPFSQVEEESASINQVLPQDAQSFCHCGI